MLKNAYFLAKIGADTAENEQHFAEILLKTGKVVLVREAARRGLVCPAAAADFFAVARAVEAAAGGATGIVQRSFPQIS